MRRLGELIINIDRISSKSSEENRQFDSLLEIIIGALINLSKHSATRSMIKEINCKSILIRVSDKMIGILFRNFFVLVITSTVFGFTTISKYFTSRIKCRLKSFFFLL